MVALAKETVTDNQTGFSVELSFVLLQLTVDSRGGSAKFFFLDFGPSELKF